MISRVKDNKKTTESEISTHIVERIIAGNRNAEEEMVYRYQRGLRAALFQKSKDRFILDDVIQDTWIVVLKRVRNGELRDPSRLAAFIIQVGRNQLIMKFRKVRTGEESIEDNSSRVLDNSLTPEQEAENRQLADVISAVFSEMGQKRDQDILKRFYLTGVTKGDLCAEYGLSASHFDRVIFRARQRFKSLWDSYKEIVESDHNGERF